MLPNCDCPFCVSERLKKTNASLLRALERIRDYKRQVPRLQSDVLLLQVWAARAIEEADE